MRLDLEVLDLAETILREEISVARDAEKHEWADHLEDVADNLADVIEALDPDNG